MKKPWKLAYRRKHPKGCCRGLLKVLERRQSEIICIDREGWVWLITQVEPMKGPADGWEMSLCWSQCSSVGLGTVAFTYPTAALYMHKYETPISFKLHANVSGVPGRLRVCKWALANASPNWENETVESFNALLSFAPIYVNTSINGWSEWLFSQWTLDSGELKAPGADFSAPLGLPWILLLLNLIGNIWLRN